jgi:hypothetical protein
MPDFWREDGNLLVHIDGTEFIFCPCNCREEFLESDSGCEYGCIRLNVGSCRACPELDECIERIKTSEDNEHEFCDTWISWDDACLSSVYKDT